MYQSTDLLLISLPEVFGKAGVVGETERMAEERGDRGTTTRHNLVEAAIDVFGTRGFDATTTRMVVARAGTQLTAISYYFANKEGLYKAAAEYIAQGIQTSMGPVLARIEAAYGPQLRRWELVELVCDLLSSFAERLVGPEIPENWSRFLSREMFEPTECFAVLFGAMSEFGRVLSVLIGRLEGEPPNHASVLLRMLTLVGGVLVFRSDRAAALQFLGWTSIGPKELKAVQSVLRGNVQRLFLRPGTQRVSARRASTRLGTKARRK